MDRNAVKVLLAGDCLGGFEALFKKVAAVNKKNGPFDLLLCVGQFFAESSDDGPIPDALSKYVDGSAQLPVKTYFIGGYGKGSAATLAALQQPAKHGSRNLYYLGRSGVTQLEALNVAYLDGTYMHRAFHAKPPPPPLNLPPPPASPTADGSGQPAAAAAAAAASPAAASPAAASPAGGGGDEAAPESLQHHGVAAAGEGEAAAAAEPAEDGGGAAVDAADGNTLPAPAAASPMQEDQQNGTAAAAGDEAQDTPAAAEAEAAADDDAPAAAEADAAVPGTHAAAAKAKQRQAEAAAAAAKHAAVQAAAAAVCRHYNQSDVARLKHQLMLLPGEVDLLLTCEWPAGVLRGLPPGQESIPGFNPRFAGNAPADLAQLARPRYHIAGGQSIFFTRIPYANPDLGAGPRPTRFVGLGSVVLRYRQAQMQAALAADAAAATAAAAVMQGMVGGQGPMMPAGDGQAAAMAAAAAGTAAAATAAADAVKVQKFLHALALVPASSMSTEALQTLPEGCGRNPYEDEQQQQQVGQKRGTSDTYDYAMQGEHCSWRWMPPKRLRGGFGGMAQSNAPFKPWGNPGVERDSSRSVFVRNLPFEATYDKLAEFFSQAGEVEDIRRQAQQDSGRPQPWCHVQFKSHASVPAAVALNMAKFMGREIMVATSTPLNKEAPPLTGAQVLPDWRMELDGVPGGTYQGPYQQQQQQQQQRQGHAAHRGRGGYRGGMQQGRWPRGQQQQLPESEPGQPVPNCWFCLSSEQVDTDLVASVADEAYMALDKGPITPQHALIIPVDHWPSLVTLPQQAAEDVLRYLSALRTAAASAGKQLVGFERYLRLRSKGGNHTHINTLPVSKEAGEGAAAVFKDMAGQAGLQLQEVPVVDGQLDLHRLREVVGDSEYFLGLLPDGSGLAAPLNPEYKAPVQLGRQVLAQLAGVPERSDWKACTYSAEEEKAAAEAFRTYFEPFDIMQKD